MHEAMLLLDTRPVRHMNLGTAVFDDRQARLDQLHGMLLGKAGRNAGGEIGVG
jgi:hypothetical protein